MNEYLSFKKTIQRSILTCILFLSFGVIYLSPILAVNFSTSKLSRSSISEESLNAWARSIKKQNLPVFLQNNIDQSSDTLTLLENYENISNQYNNTHFIKLSSVIIKEKELSNVKVDFENKEEQDEAYLKGQSYLLNEGTNGLRQEADLTLIIGKSEKKVEDYFVQDIVVPKDKIKFTGSANEETIKEKLKEDAQGVINSLKQKDQERFENLLYSKSQEEYQSILSLKELSLKINDTQVAEIIFDPKEGEFDELVEVGGAKITNLRCNDSTNLPVVYDKIKRVYAFSSILNEINSLCDDKSVYIPPANVEILTCTDCTYAPVDKEHALGSSYKPQVVGTGLTGGGYLTVETSEQLKLFFADGMKNGFNLNVVSAYRSYDDQVYTFNYWVQREIAKGASRAVAEERANVYSARPGHSEHQLGTTVDLGDADCPAFDEPCNKPAYKYIGENAHKFGFVVSYPKNSFDLTGYKHEPWHLRYIGKELALELYDRDYLSSGIDYLAKFLLEKKLY